jgi:hypothetical protein
MPRLPRSMNGVVLGALTVSGLLVTSCVKPMPFAKSVSPSCSHQLVPALPPVTGMSGDLAKTIYAPANIVLEDSVETGPYPRDMIWLWFRNGASQAERRDAVDAICGIVVGGFRFRPGGVYYVHIAEDGTTVPLDTAIRKLMTFPQVMSATPDLSSSQNSSRVP